MPRIIRNKNQHGVEKIMVCTMHLKCMSSPWWTKINIENAFKKSFDVWWTSQQFFLTTMSLMCRKIAIFCNFPAQHCAIYATNRASSETLNYELRPPRSLSRIGQLLHARVIVWYFDSACECQADGWSHRSFLVLQAASPSGIIRLRECNELEWICAGRRFACPIVKPPFHSNSCTCISIGQIVYIVLHVICANKT